MHECMCWWVCRVSSGVCVFVVVVVSVCMRVVMRLMTRVEGVPAIFHKLGSCSYRRRSRQVYRRGGERTKGQGKKEREGRGEKRKKS